MSLSDFSINIFTKWHERQPDVHHKGELAACALFQAERLVDAVMLYKNWVIDPKKCKICGTVTAWVHGKFINGKTYWHCVGKCGNEDNWRTIRLC